MVAAGASDLTRGPDRRRDAVVPREWDRLAGVRIEVVDVAAVSGTLTPARPHL
jgi:hypothetical protein